MSPRNDSVVLDGDVVGTSAQYPFSRETISGRDFHDGGLPYSVSVSYYDLVVFGYSSHVGEYSTARARSVARAEGFEPSCLASGAIHAPAHPNLERAVGIAPTLMVSRTVPATSRHPNNVADHVGVEPTSAVLEAALCPR